MARGDCPTRPGDQEEALREALIAAVANPDRAVAYTHLGHTLRAMNETQAAEEAFRHALAVGQAPAGPDTRNV
jgi:Flp pilus assembly protein TadD